MVTPNSHIHAVSIRNVQGARAHQGAISNKRIIVISQQPYCLQLLRHQTDAHLQTDGQPGARVHTERAIMELKIGTGQGIGKMQEC